MKGLFVRKNTLHQDEKKMTSEVDSLPKMLDLIHISFIMLSWLLRPLHINQMLFFHRPDSMLVLKINPIVGFVANYLYLVLGYLGKFLYYKTVTGWT